MMDILPFFKDPVLRAPTIGCMLMCLSSSLMGAIFFLRKKSLVGEALSHAAYPGVVAAVLVAEIAFPKTDNLLSFLVLIGAFLTSFIGLKIIENLEKGFKINSDAALCFILSFFFGIGILLSSYLQNSYAKAYNQTQVFLYGQAATMVDAHIKVYGLLALLIIIFIIASYRHLQACNFDKTFSQTLGLRVALLENITSLFLTLSIVIGIRSVGVVLMSGMLLIPASCARPLCKKLSTFFILSGFFGLLSGFMGNYLSVTIAQGLYTLPTGPMILLSAATLCLISLLLAPKSGLFTRCLRMARFRMTCQMENYLKDLWKHEACADTPSRWIRLSARLKGWTKTSESGKTSLSLEGRKRALKIIRLHRLWEVYLVNFMGQGVEKVHKNAEELEHLFTQELESQLTELLKDPKTDPHAQPIPPRELL